MAFITRADFKARGKSRTPPLHDVGSHGPVIRRALDVGHIERAGSAAFWVPSQMPCADLCVSSVYYVCLQMKFRACNFALRAMTSRRARGARTRGCGVRFRGGSARCAQRAAGALRMGYRRVESDRRGSLFVDEIGRQG